MVRPTLTAPANCVPSIGPFSMPISARERDAVEAAAQADCEVQREIVAHVQVAEVGREAGHDAEHEGSLVDVFVVGAVRGREDA